MQSKDADPERFFGKLKERMQRCACNLNVTTVVVICESKLPVDGPEWCTTRKCICRAGIDLASVEVRFQNLSIDADIAVGARGEPTVLNAYRNKLEVNASLPHAYLPDTNGASALYSVLHDPTCAHSVLRAASVVQGIHRARCSAILPKMVFPWIASCWYVCGVLCQLTQIRLCRAFCNSCVS